MRYAAVPPGGTPFDPLLVGKALGERLAAVEAAMERLGAFVFSGGDTAHSGVADHARRAAERTEAARQLVLRALSAVGDAVDFRILLRLADADASLEDLARLVDVPRVAVWERVGDLVQVGLVARALQGDRVGLTPAGEGLVHLVEQLAAAAAGVEAGAETGVGP